MRFLSRAQLDAWTTFGSEWNYFKEEWLRRGLLWPPSGSFDDDANSQSQRHMLWEVLDARSTDLVRWTREAPGRKSHEVVAYIVDHYHAILDQAVFEDDVDEGQVYWARRQEKEQATVRLRDILSRVSE